MKRLIIASLSAVILASGISSCSSSESVVSNNFLQKRKYNKGFHKSTRKSKNNNEKNNIETLAFNDNNFVEKKEFKNNVAINPTKTPQETTTKVSVKNEITQNNSIGETTIKKGKKATENYNKNESIISKTINKVEKNIIKNSNVASVSNTENTQDVNTLLLYILCFFIPFLAVGIVTDWNVGTVLLNLLLCLLFFIPGLIHALIVVSKNT